MRIHWKKALVITTDILLAGYLVLAFTAFNKPDESQRLCTRVNIDIQDKATNGFINAQEIKNRLEKEHLYPLSQPMRNVSLREMEELLKASPFVKTAECYKTEGGTVNITLTQRMPVVRVKASNGDDYYLDDKDCIMPNSHYTSDLIIATGDISKSFATHYLSPMSKAIMANPLWSNQIEQINVLPDKTIELVPRVGHHIVGLGAIPYNKYKSKRNAVVTASSKRNSIGWRSSTAMGFHKLAGTAIVISTWHLTIRLFANGEMASPRAKRTTCTRSLKVM